jgi:FKBP-type peptidyl-prolyl cis-trans isomerase FklB
MPRRLVVVLLIAAFMGGLWLVGRPLNAQTEGEPVEVDMEQVSYAMGVDMGRRISDNLVKQDIDLSTQRMIAGFEAGLTGEGVEMSDEQIDATIQSFQMAMMQKQRQQAMAEAQENQARGIAFLKENALKEGVETTESGLQYQILEAGEGQPPTMGDQVTVHYHGELLDGTVFDSSKEPPQPGREPGPATFTLGEVIEGWNEGLGLIGEGGKVRLFIPPDLAYGQRGSRPGPGGEQAIGPNQTLVFDVELLEVNRAEADENPDAE